MKEQEMLADSLPDDVFACVEQLKRSESRLSAEVEERLYQARQKALGRVAERRQQHPLGDVLAWVSFGHPRMMGLLAFSLGILIASIIWTGMQNNDDAMMLGDDLPIEAFVDNGFDAWGMGE